MNRKETFNAIILGIKDYFKKNNFQKAVIGLSGGLDSSVAVYLTAKALGSRNVTAVLMPDFGTSSKESMSDSKEIVKKLKINHEIISINGFVENFEKINKNLKFKKNVFAVANAKARARMMILYYIANMQNALVIGTSDKSEIALGYTTKYGDNASDILVIGDLYKTEVIEMGKYLGVPLKILNKKPSAELISGVNAEKELGASYKILDKILELYIEKNLSKNEIEEKGFDKKVIENVARRIRINEHKRRSPAVIRLSEKSFHNMEWRMPITNKFEE